MPDHDRSKASKKGSTRRSSRPSAVTNASPADTFEFGSNGDLASALDGAHPSTHDGTFSFGEGGVSASTRDGSTPILDQAATAVDEAAPAGFDFTDPETLRQIQLEADMKWAAKALSLEVGLAAAIGATDRAFRGLVTGDADGLAGGTVQMLDVLDELHYLQAELELDLRELDLAGVPSATVRAIGPRVSRVVERGTVPAIGSEPSVVFSPTRSLKAAGIRTEPPVSLPKAAMARPRATATALPLEEPPGTRVGSKALPGVPVWGLSPSPPKASSVMVLLPRKTAPAWSSRATTGASCEAGARPKRAALPAAVTSPAVSIRSLSTNGTPSSGPRKSPRSQRRWAAAA
jgi:hypothetical protein